MNSNGKIVMSFEEGKHTVNVSISKGKGSFEQAFDVSSDVITGLFNKDWSTGYFSVSQDGPIYLETRGDLTLVVAQRASRQNQTIRWGRGENPEVLSVTTPWAVGLFILKKNPEGHYHLRDSWLYTTTGPALGAYTQLKSAHWMGNVYNDDRICWGTTQVNRTTAVAISSVTNFINEFFLETFTPDIATSNRLWTEFTESGTNPGPSIGSLSSTIARIWRNELGR